MEIVSLSYKAVVHSTTLPDKPTDQDVKNWQGPKSAKGVQTRQMEPFSTGWLIT